ncbi:MAG: cytochrome c-type biogenesis protein CcmH [Actinobacteria bacterium]|nr:cytochrome c-type biogenesis protein CcmH [Actinomycetota bacterium]
MREKLRRWAYPLAALALTAVIVGGVLTAAPRPVDRVDALSHRLRCPVCQGESVADSPSETATQIRDQVAEMVAAGRTDAEILDHYVARYGRWVLLDPPLAGDTVLLWLLPLAAAAGGLAIVVSRRRSAAPWSDLSESDRLMIATEIARARAGEDTA